MRERRVIAAWGVSLATLLASWSVALHAQAPGAAPALGARVELRFEGAWPEELRADVAAGVIASVGGRGVEVRVMRGEEAPPTVDDALASLVLSAPSVASPSSTITVRDRLTRKLVERTVSLGGDPVDVWSVLLAAAADELLRASWIELSMPDAPPPSVPPPAVIEEIVARSVDPPLPSDGAWGLEVNAELAAGEGGLLVGGRVATVLGVLDPVLFALGVGGLGLVPQVSERARIEGGWVYGDLEARVALVPRRGDARLALVALARAGVLVVSADANTGYVGTTEMVPTAALFGGLRGGLALSRGTQLTLGVLVGAPLLGVVVSDGAEDVAALAGPTVLVDLGVEIWP